MAAHQRPDVTSCGPPGAGPRCRMSLGCGRRWGRRDERRKSSASEVGTDDGIATTTTTATKTTTRITTIAKKLQTGNVVHKTADLSGDELMRVVPRKAVMWHYHTTFLVESGW